MHLENQSIKYPILIDSPIFKYIIKKKMPKIVYIQSSPSDNFVRHVEVKIKNKIEYFAHNTEIFFKKWDRDATKHYLITDYLLLNKERDRDRREALTSLKKNYFRQSKEDILKDYRDLIKVKFKTNYKLKNSAK
jgi:hypothetical protein